MADAPWRLEPDDFSAYRPRAFQLLFLRAWTRDGRPLFRHLFLNNNKKYERELFCGF